MTEREKRKKVINKVKAIVADMQEEVDEWKDYSDSELRGGLTCDCDWWYKTLQTLKDALVILKAQKEATVEPKRIDLEEETKAWLDNMDAVDALANIANICIDWDGYRTADGLGGLVNEIWAYARYCADRLAKEHEPRVMTLDEYKAWADIPFCERDPIFHEMKLRRGPVTGWTNTAECSKDNYGKTERCWTSRPDQATMEATPWN